MVKDSTFWVKLTGRPKTSTSIDKVKLLLNRWMIKIDPSVEITTINFAQIRYSLTWNGEPKHIEYIDQVYSAAVRYAEKELERWEIGINVHYTEDSKGE